MDSATQRKLIETVAKRDIDAADELTTLDPAIGDGDHGLNMKRGIEAVVADSTRSRANPCRRPQRAGMALVMKVGGASGPLYGTFCMTLARNCRRIPPALPVKALGSAVEAVKARGKPRRQKTMLDVLVPLHDNLARGAVDAAGVRTPGCQPCRRNRADEGDPRPCIVSRRAFDRAHGSRRTLSRSSSKPSRMHWRAGHEWSAL